LFCILFADELKGSLSCFVIYISTQLKNNFILQSVKQTQTTMPVILSAFYDYFDTILETLFETFYIFVWIIYVNNYFFRYNQRIRDLEVETVGLRRMVYALLNEKTKTNHFSRNYASAIAFKKNEKNDSVLTERVNKLKRMMLSLREEIDELKCRIDDIEDNDYEPSREDTDSEDTESD
jgi:hypothetical protein